MMRWHSCLAIHRAGIGPCCSALRCGAARILPFPRVHQPLCCRNPVKLEENHHVWKRSPPPSHISPTADSHIIGLMIDSSFIPWLMRCVIREYRKMCGVIFLVMPAHFTISCENALPLFRPVCLWPHGHHVVFCLPHPQINGNCQIQ